MTFSARSGTPRRGRRTRAKLLPGILILLGLVATGYLVFADSVELLRLGLMAAVWAATIAVFAMTRYRRESDLDRSKVDDLQTVYRLQLEREISARREYELGVEARVRREVSVEAEELAGLRTELAALRRNLEFLFAGDLPDERIALRTESTRVAELMASGGWASRADDEPGARTPAPAYGEQESEAPRFASPYDAPVTAEITAIELDARLAEATAEPIVEKTEEVSDESAEEAVGAHESAGARVESVVEQSVEAVPAGEPVPPIEPGPEGEPISRRRRRSADNEELGPGTTGLSVAQILASLAAEKSDAQQVPDPSK